MRLWKAIVETVEASGLSKASQARVLKKLDKTVGTYIIESFYPPDIDGLTVDEAEVFMDIIRALNEGVSFGTVRNAEQYDRVVQTILDSTGGKLPRHLRPHMIAMDVAFQNRDWKVVNEHLRHIEKLL